MRSKYEEFRTQADECLRMSRVAANEDNRVSWLKLAAEWLRMIPAKEHKTPEEKFRAQLRSEGTGQPNSISSH